MTIVVIVAVVLVGVVAGYRFVFRACERCGSRDLVPDGSRSATAYCFDCGHKQAD